MDPRLRGDDASRELIIRKRYQLFLPFFAFAAGGRPIIETSRTKPAKTRAAGCTGAICAAGAGFAAARFFPFLASATEGIAASARTASSRSIYAYRLLPFVSSFTRRTHSN